MLTIYIIAAVVGGVLVVLSLFGGHHESDASTDVSHDSDHGADHGDGPWVPFLSLRFWTYFATVFGLSGLVLSQISKTPEPMAVSIAAVAGLAVGLIVSYTMRALSRTDLDSSINPADMMGLEVQVLVAVRPGQAGRVRLTLKGEIIDVLATTDGDEAMEAGSRAVIVDLDGDRVKVVSRDSIFGSPQSLEEQSGLSSS